MTGTDIAFIGRTHSPSAHSSVIDVKKAMYKLVRLRFVCIDKGVVIAGMKKVSHW
jgi:hypothetical protein